LLHTRNITPSIEWTKVERGSYKYFKTFGCTPQNHCVHARPNIRCSEAVWLWFRLSMYIGSFYLWQLDGPSRSLKCRPPLYKLHIKRVRCSRESSPPKQSICLLVWMFELPSLDSHDVWILLNTYSNEVIEKVVLQLSNIKLCLAISTQWTPNFLHIVMA